MSQPPTRAAGAGTWGDDDQHAPGPLLYADALRDLAGHKALIFGLWRTLGDADWQELKLNRGTVDTVRDKLQETINALESLRGALKTMQEQKYRSTLEGQINKILGELDQARIELTIASLNANATAIARTRQFLNSISACRKHLYNAHNLFHRS